MQFAVSILLSGISVGGQYALIAIGYTLVYGILRLINFAHGDVFMTAGLILVYASASMPLYVSVPLMIIAVAALGFCIETVAYKPLRSAPRMSVMISAIGVSFLIQNFATYYTGGLPQSYPRLPFLSESVVIYGTSTKWVTIVTPFLVVALVVALQILINKTKIGLAMRAAAKDFETCQLMGIKIKDCAPLWLHARSEGFRSRRVRRYRLHPRCSYRSIYHRHLREHYQRNQLHRIL